MRKGSSAPARRGRISSTIIVGLALAAAGAGAEELLPARFGVTGPLALPGEPAARAMPRGQGGAPVAAAVPEDAGGPGLTAEFGPLGLPCGASLSAEAAPGGTARLRLEAPCQPGAAVTISHGALSVTFRASSSGVIDTVLPAFEDAARYSARLPDGELLTASALVPGASAYERVVTMWEGAGGLSVHAFEYGAGRGEAGHVWRGAPRGAQAAEAGRGGFLLALGTAEGAGARRAEVYSFPAAVAARAGAVRIALAAAVTPATCGGEIEAETLQLGEGLPGAPVAVRVTLPDCAAAAGDLMLKNLARDLKIAAQ
ncbi:MAG: hypothetical protein OEM24_01990 [Paracoccaceae bacterium]|nr:hypothetical protein [Paracoccaceae bacterium]